MGLSGTSGGALCAVTAWYGLLSEGPDYAGELLEDVWCDVAATTPPSFLLNESLVWRKRLQDSMLPAADISPYATKRAEPKPTRFWRMPEYATEPPGQ